MGNRALMSNLYLLLSDIQTLIIIGMIAVAAIVAYIIVGKLLWAEYKDIKRHMNRVD